MNFKENNLVENIEKKIKSGQVKMKAKSYFMLRAALLIVAGLFIVLVAIFLLSLMIFILRSNGAWLMPGLGLRGILGFLVSVPWLLILVGLILLLGLEIFVKKYTFAYRRPVVYSVLGIIIFVGLCGVLLSQTSLHENWARKAHEEHWPIAGSIYHGYKHMPVKDMYLGVANNIDVDGFELLDQERGFFVVRVLEKTKFFQEEPIVEGDLIMVFGPLNQEQEIEAIHIRKLEKDFRMGRPGRMMDF